MSDQAPDTQAQTKEVRDLTKVVRQIDIKDPKRKENETQMKTTEGKICKFTE